MKDYYIDKWKQYLSYEKEIKDQIDPFQIITDIWAHKPIIKSFYKTRINPNFLNDGIRNDLEFYIPQLCTFLIFGQISAVEEFLAVLCKICFTSFQFTHKVVWFMRSLLNQFDDKSEEK